MTRHYKTSRALLSPLIGGGVGFMLTKNGTISISSLAFLLGLLILCVTVIIIIYRITQKADLVALIKAWRSKEISDIVPPEDFPRVVAEATEEVVESSSPP